MIARPYSGAADLPLLIDFLAAERQRNPVQRWHVGDLIWRMFYSSHFDPAANVCLWENDGKVVGFGWLYPPSGADLCAADAALLPEMIDWAQSHSQPEDFYIATLDACADEAAAYAARGFQPQPPYGSLLRRQLAGDFPAAPMPKGFVLRSLTGESEAPARAAAHRLAFDSQAVTDDGYRNLVLHAPLYQRDLDLLVIAPDGQIAAFCLCWLDTVNRVGLFEPVGTHPAYRRRGLARVVMTEGLRRMQAEGMESVRVVTAAGNAASTALYQSLGFVVESSERVYLRP
ncbi:MAG: GNAT family N-acetyltransferase [Chloroflexi bacterium]|nr:GNAT family N-acetyltransferase [Chloroflexota bacterium]